jgi:hydroxyethylthiazole kinase-like uncharacterized protein yjeF
VIRVLTPDAMGAADKATIDSGTPSVELMERAGYAVSRAVLKLTSGSYGRRVVIVCGKGNNAGDGFVAARHLSQAGALPVIVMLEEPSSLSADAKTNQERLGRIPLFRYSRDRLRRELRRADAAVDAIVGTGFRGELREPAAEAVGLLNESGIPVIAVDIPSGVNGETGAVEGPAVNATATVTMGAPKTGLVVGPGATLAGTLEAADIGVDTAKSEADLLLVTETDVADFLPERGSSSDKRSVGTVLVVAGSVGMAGAPALVARGAMRGGAGLVTVAAPEVVAISLHQIVPEGTTLPLPSTDKGSISPQAISQVLERAEKLDVVAIGPGLSTNPETFEFVKKILTELDKPVVLDADGINALAGDPEGLASRGAPTVITPHVRELGRLLGVDSAEIETDRVQSAKLAAQRSGATVLLKGFRTIVATPKGEAYVIPTGGPILATGGSGDVLTGLIAALIAGAGPERATDAAWAGAWIHGRAGDLLAENVADRGLVAADIADALPEVFGSLAR